MGFIEYLRNKEGSFCILYTGPLCGEFASHKGQWRGALIFFISAWINGRVNNPEAGDLRLHRGHYDVTISIQVAAS